MVCAVVAFVCVCVAQIEVTNVESTWVGNLELGIFERRALCTECNLSSGVEEGVLCCAVLCCGGCYRVDRCSD